LHYENKDEFLVSKLIPFPTERGEGIKTNDLTVLTVRVQQLKVPYLFEWVVRIIDDGR
jgi:hypothetical protein